MIKKEEKPKKTYSVISKLIFAVIIFLIILEAIAVVSGAGSISNVYRDWPSVTIIVTIMFIAIILLIIFGKNIDKWGESIDSSGSGKDVKWLQLLHLWPELSIDKKSDDKKFKSFMSISRYIWWTLVVIPIGVIIYFFIKINQF